MPWHLLVFLQAVLDLVFSTTESAIYVCMCKPLILIPSYLLAVGSVHIWNAKFSVKLVCEFYYNFFLLYILLSLHSKISGLFCLLVFPTQSGWFRCQGYRRESLTDRFSSLSRSSSLSVPETRT